MNRLILLGAVHRDPAGKGRLLRVLEEIRPTVISLEVSPASVELRRKLAPRWRKVFRRRLGELSRQTGLKPGQLMVQSGIRGVFEYSRLPYEFRASMAYARSRDCPLFLLDDSNLAETYLNRLEEEILSSENMTLLTKAKGDKTLDEDVAAEYARARARVYNPRPWPGAWLGDQETRAQREAQLSKKIRLLHQGLARRTGREVSGQDLVRTLIVNSEALAHVPDKVRLDNQASHLYVGGWEHLVEDEAGTSLYSHLKDLAPDRRLCYDPGPGYKEVEKRNIGASESGPQP